MRLTRRYFTKNLIVGLTAIPASCLISTDARAADISLKVSHAWPNRSEFLGKLKSEFEAVHGGIQLEFVSGGDNWQPLLQSTLRGALISDLPDITHQLINYTRPLFERGIAQPIDTIPGGQEFISSMNISPALAEAATIERHLYAIPFGLTIPVVFYNMKLLKSAGWDLDRTPQTWDEIISIVPKIAALGGNISGGFFEYEASNNWMYQNVLSGLGGGMETEDRRIGFDSELGIKAMSIISQFANAADTISMSRDQARQAFNAGAMGMLFRSASGIPSVIEAAQANDFELEVGAFPVKTGVGKLVASSHGIFILTKDVERQKAALQYLEWAYGPKAQALQAEYGGYLPANAAALDSDEFAEHLQSNPYLSNLTASLSGVGDWYAYPTANSDQIFDAQIEIMRSVVTGRIDAEAAVADMSISTLRLLE